MTQQLLCRAGQYVAVIIALATSGFPANAQLPFPNGTIRVVAPFSASTPPGIIRRIMAKELSESENWRTIVENRPGGVTTIAANDVLMQSADGHNLYAMTVPSVAAPSLVPNISYRFDTDFEPVIKASVSYNVLVVNPSVPAHSVAELVALLKSQPDKLTFSSGGFGTPAHLIGEQFKLQTGTRAQHVPYAQSLCAISPGHRRPAERDERLHVHHHVAGDRPDQDRQAARTCRNRPKARAGLVRCSNDRRSRLFFAGRGGFCRIRRQARHAERNRRAAQ